MAVGSGAADTLPGSSFFLTEHWLVIAPSPPPCCPGSSWEPDPSPAPGVALLSRQVTDPWSVISMGVGLWPAWANQTGGVAFWGLLGKQLPCFYLGAPGSDAFWSSRCCLLRPCSLKSLWLSYHHPADDTPANRLELLSYTSNAFPRCEASLHCVFSYFAAQSIQTDTMASGTSQQRCPAGTRAFCLGLEPTLGSEMEKAL